MPPLTEATHLNRNSTEAAVVSRETTTKKSLRASVAGGGQKRGVGKKDRRRIRSELLHKRLAAAEAAKMAVKAKKVRERTVIVKDIQPLLENLEDIEEDIKKVKIFTLYRYLYSLFL